MGSKTRKKLTDGQAKTRKRAAELRRARYGMVKPKVGQRFAWLSQENKNGWSLGISIGDMTYWLKNVRFKSRKEIERVMVSSIVFIHLKNSKEEA